MLATPDLILFAIQGALRLGLEARQACVDATRNRALVLPLPDFDPACDLLTALTHFAQNPADVGKSTRLVALIDKYHSDGALLPEEEGQVIAYFQEIRLLDGNTWTESKSTPEGTFLTRDFVTGMVTVRQWAREGEGGVTPLQRVAGAVIELAVDYFAHVPGALNVNSRQGKVLKAVLEALDGVELADQPLSTLPERLTAATIEGIGAGASVFISDIDHQALVKQAASALAHDVANRIQTLRTSGGANADAEDAIAQWAETIFRSLLSSAGALVVKDPGKYLGIDGQDKQALISRVGGAVLDMVLAQPPGGMRKAFGRDGIDVVVKAAVAVVGDHPQLVSGKGNEPLAGLLRQIAGDLGKFPTLVDGRNLPAITDIILHCTGENLDRLWPAAARHPETHLLLTATRTVMGILEDRLVHSGMALSSADVTLVVEAVVAEVAANPAWIITDAAHVDPALGVAVRATLQVLASRQPALGGTVVRDMLIAAISAVALNLDLIKTLPGEAGIAVAALLDAVVTILWEGGDPETKWRTTRPEVILGVTAVVLRRGARLKIDPAVLAKVKSAVAAHAASLRSGAPWDPVAFATALDAALS